MAAVRAVAVVRGLIKNAAPNSSMLNRNIFIRSIFLSLRVFIFHLLFSNRYQRFEQASQVDTGCPLSASPIKAGKKVESANRDIFSLKFKAEVVRRMFNLPAACANYT